MFIGRAYEAKQLENLYRAKDSKLAVLYGRRRVGKSTLIANFIANKPHLNFEGIEHGKTPAQIAQVTHDLSLQLNDPILGQATINQWALILDRLTTYFAQSNKKVILFLDEFQWLSANQSKLVSLIKKYWDQYWSKQNVLLILCGSVSSYMVNKVIKSKALYGRIDWELCLQALLPSDCLNLLGNKRSQDETFQYLLLLGGIPKYLNAIDTNKSFDQNINDLFFTENGLFVHEYEKVFYSQFKEHQTYEKIIAHIKDRPLFLDEIAQKINMASGGGLKSYLDNLESAMFISQYTRFDRNANSKLKKYKLTDEYLRFYHKYVVPYVKLIKSNRKRNLFTQLVKPKWQSWLGFTFENFCMKNAIYLAEKMGFADHVLQWGPLFNRQDQHFQIDLIYVRTDNVITICELKYHLEPIPISVVHEVEKKCQLLKIERGFTVEKALISRFGPDPALAELGYFHHYLMVEDLFL